MSVYGDSTVYAGVNWNDIPNPMGLSVTMFYSNTKKEKAVLFTDTFVFSGWNGHYGKITEVRFFELFLGKSGYYRIPAYVLEVVLHALNVSVKQVDWDEIERDATIRNEIPFRMFDLFTGEIHSGSKCCNIDQTRLTELFGNFETYFGCSALSLRHKAEDEIMAGNFLSPLMVWGGVTILATDRLPFESEEESESRIRRCLTEKTKERRREIFCPDPFSVCRNEFIAKMK